MPIYNYKAKDPQGKTRSETAEAASEQALADRLQGEGCFIISITRANEKGVVKVKQKAQKFTRAGIKLDDLLVFSRQLATMLESGVTLLRTLDVILQQIQSKELARVVKEMRDDVEQGKSLSMALAKHPKVFNQFWVSLVEVGEASGTMPTVLNKLAVHIEQEAEFKSIIVSAMVYPMILGVVCIGAVVFFAMVVAPKFEEIFTQMHSELPPLTRILLAFFKFVKEQFLWIFAGAGGLIFAFKAYIKTTPGLLTFESFLFNLPVIGEVTKLIVVERFSAQMSILVDSGVPILYALEITERLVENKTCAIVICEVRDAVREGQGLADSMIVSDFFPGMAVQMIKVGEETGELGKMLKHVAAFYQSNVEAFMKRFGTLIEPFMLVFMAGMIGVIVVAIFLPLFKMGQAH